MAKTKEMTREQVATYISENWVHLTGKYAKKELNGQNDDLYEIVDRAMKSPRKKVRSELAKRMEWSEGLVRKNFIL